MYLIQLFLIGSILFSSTAFAQDTTFSNKPFTDVPASSTGFESIDYLRTQNVVRGYMDGTYKPNARINRAEFVEFIINPFILDTNGRGECVKKNASTTSMTIFFSDVSKDAWYAENVCFSKIKEIVDGYPNGTFNPAGFINFVEAAKIISNVFSLQIQNEGTGEFWYRPYVKNLSDLHAIPVSIQRFDQQLTRGEMAEIVYRLKVEARQKTSTSIDNLR